MKRILLIALGCCSLVLMASAAFAQNTHAPGGLGFHNTDAPVGGRWWLSGQKVGIDAGVGFGSSPSGIDPDESLTNFAINFGVPFVLKSWDGVHVLFRPGIHYASDQVGFDSDPLTAGVQFDTENQTTFAVQAEIEAEVFLRDNVSVSASHGIAFSSFNPGFDADSQTSFGTTGNNFTTLGFHVYFLGNGQ
jgi:hypothetical protein